MMVGRSTVAAAQLQAFVERFERLGAEKKQITADAGEVMAEAKAAGFVAKGLRRVLKLRAMKPHDREEEEAIVDVYLHALGETHETPLHRTVAAMSVDIASREQVIEAMKMFVPESGAITVEMGGKPFRLARADDGEVTVTEVTMTPASAAEPKLERPSRAKSAPVPEVSGGIAFDMGRDAFKANEPIISNPFPYGHAHRPRWDEGWRKESGTDGMGPSGDDGDDED